MELYRKLEFIRAKATSSYWAGRINAEIGFAANLSIVRDHKYDALVDSAADFLMNGMKQDGVITDSCAKAVEKMLYPISADAKSYKIRCISHAHIDMNWMWGFQETVSVTVDTFRTVLELMREYPDLTFGQSQASTYRIIEEYAPEMFDEINDQTNRVY